MRANPTNGRSWRSLGETRRRAGDLRGAVAAYEHAIELGDRPAETAYAIAACDLRLADRSAGLAALERAFALGYRDLEVARADPDFAALRDEPRFLALVGLPGRPFASRDDGWRFDLGLVVRELHRRGYDPFRRLSATELDARFAALVVRVGELSDSAVIVELVRLLRLVGDGHTGVLAVRRPEYALALPISMYLFDDGLYVTAAAPRWRELVGARIIRIGGHSIDQVLAALDPMISRDNEMWPKAVAPYRMRSTPLLHALGLLPAADRAVLSIVDAAGAPRDVAVDADASAPDIWNQLPHPAGWIGVTDRPQRSLPLGARDNDRAYWLAYDAPSRMLYVQYNRVVDDPREPLAAFAVRVSRELRDHDVQRLVIDLRNNNGGDTFVNEAFLRTLLETDGLRTRGRLFVLIGRRTFSAAMNAAMYLERFFDPVFVGEPTGGKPNSPGDEVPFTLPYSQVVVNISDVYWESGWPRDRRTWLAPERYAPPTFAALSNGRDAALDAVLTFSP